MSSPISLPIEINPSNITELYARVARAGNIQDLMAISNFLNPLDEVVNEETQQDPDEVLQDVIAEHLGLQQDSDNEEDEAQLDMPIYSIQEARKALQVLIDFTESRDDVQTTNLRAIERYNYELASN